MARKTAKELVSATPTPRAASTSIAWPAITRTQASFATIHPGLIQADNFFDRQSVKTWLAFLESPASPVVLTPPTPGPPLRGNAARTNDRFGCDDPAFARTLWEASGLKELAEAELGSASGKRKPVGLNPNIRLYRYTAGAYFGRKLLPLSLTFRSDC